VNSKTCTRVCFLWTLPNSEHIGCVFCESLHQTVYLALGCVSFDSLPVFLPRIEWPTIQSAPTYMWALLSSLLHNTTSNNEFLDWGWWWWLPRSSTVELARSRVQQQFSSLRQERFQIHVWCYKVRTKSNGELAKVCTRWVLCDAGLSGMGQLWSTILALLTSMGKQNSLPSVLHHYMIY
jgi:hypothetical protein